MSAAPTKIENMFDGVDEAGLLAEMSAAQRTERIAVARRLLAAGRLCQLRTAGLATADRAQWCVDNWEAVAAEVAAELGISRGRASAQMHYGVELLERLPRLAAVFAAGEVDLRVVSVVLFRTGLVTDTAALAAIDAALAARVGRWNRLSRPRVVALVDQWVSTLDPAALRAARSADRGRHITFGDIHHGMVEVWGSLRGADAAVVEKALDGLAATVCPADPRTRAQRRADGLAALAAGAAALGCECGAADCPAGAAPRPAVVITVLAEAATLAGDSQAPGHLPGWGPLPAEAVRAMAIRARVRTLARPEDRAAESGYRPSAGLAAFIRARDLCCRFPGCDAPAEVCDIDHTVPWGRGGATHPANLGLLCRVHHLLKTFWDGENGWRVMQSADATFTWTSPSGRVYTTTPGGALLFPALADPSGTTPGPATGSPATPGRTLMMPTRRRTRAEERAARIAWERGLNEKRWAAGPPPF